MMMILWFLVFPRKRLSCSESSFIESDSSPPSGTRRRFSALIDTQRLASPLEVDSELHIPFKQHPVKARGASLEGAMGSGPSQGDLRSFLTATGHSREDVSYNCIIHQFTPFQICNCRNFVFQTSICDQSTCFSPCRAVPPSWAYLIHRCTAGPPPTWCCGGFDTSSSRLKGRRGIHEQEAKSSNPHLQLLCLLSSLLVNS